MAILFDPHFQAISPIGLPLSGARLHFYRAQTTSRITIYQDADATTPHTNPVIADASGLFPPIFIATTSPFKTVLQSALGITIQTIHKIPVSDAGDLGLVQNFYATLALEQAEDRMYAPVTAGPDGNGLFDGFNVLTYVDTAGATGLDTSEAGVLKPFPLKQAATLAFTNDSPNYAGYNLRFRIPAAQLSGKGNQIRLRLYGVTVGAPLVIATAYVGHKAATGNVWNFDGGQKQLRVGGATGFTVPVGGDVETDWIDFNFDDSRDLVLSMYCTSGDLRVGTIASGGIGGSFSTKEGADETGVTAPSGYTTSGSLDRGVCNRIQVRTGAMSVRSSALTLSEEPDWAQLYFIADLADAVMNMDLLVSVSRDGTDYMPLAASHLYQRPDGSGVFATAKTDLTSAAGTIGRWRIETLNAKQPKVLALGVMFGVD